MDVEANQLNEKRQRTDNVSRKKRNAKYRIVHGSSVERRRRLHYQLHASSEKRKLKERRAHRRRTELAEKSAIVEALKNEWQKKHRQLHHSSEKRRRQIRYKRDVSSERRKLGGWCAANYSVERRKRRVRYIENAVKEKMLYRSYYASHIDQMKQKNLDWLENNSLKQLSVIFSLPDKDKPCLSSPEAINIDKANMVTDSAQSVAISVNPYFKILSIKNAEEEQAGNKIDKNIYRCCLCDLQTNWATTLHEALLQLVGTEGKYESMRNALVAFESTYPNCFENDSCTDQLKWLRFMSQHSSKLRSFLHRFYEIRMDHIWLLRCEFAVDFGQWEEFNRLTDEAPYTLASNLVKNIPETRPNIWAHSAISETCFKAIKEFERIVHDFPVKFCHVCTELKHGLKELNDLRDYLATNNNGRFKQPTSARVAKYVEEKHADEAKLLDSLAESFPSDPIDEICEQVARGACTTVVEISNLADVDLPEFEKMLESQLFNQQ